MCVYIYSRHGAKGGERFVAGEGLGEAEGEAEQVVLKNKDRQLVR